MAFQKQNSVVGISQDFMFIAGEENLLRPGSIPWSDGSDSSPGMSSDSSLNSGDTCLALVLMKVLAFNL